MIEPAAPTEPAITPAAGWYDDPEQPKVQRFWNGNQWGAPTLEDRQAALAGRIAYWTKWGWRVESQVGEQVVLVEGHRPNHVLHLILSIITLGLWLIVWLILSIVGGEKRKTISIDADGYMLAS